MFPYPCALPTAFDLFSFPETGGLLQKFMLERRPKAGDDSCQTQICKGGQGCDRACSLARGDAHSNPRPSIPVAAPSSEWMNFSKRRVCDSCLTHPGAQSFKADDPGSSFNFLSAPFWIDIDAVEAGSRPNSSGSQIWTLGGKCGIYQYAHHELAMIQFLLFVEGDGF